MPNILTRRVVATFSVCIAAGILIFACSSDTAESPTAVPTDTAVPEEATATPEPPAPTQDQTGDDTVADSTTMDNPFAEWGPTCLNGVYPSEAPMLDDVDVSQYVDGANGLKYYILSEGEGAVPDPGWEVDVQYTGWLESGCIFDSSYTRSQPTVFPVNQVIPGWQLSLTEMQVGERRRVEIPPSLAYGADGSPPVIPENATLTFDIILVGGTSQDATNALATQVADELFIQATREAESFDASSAEFAPITVDYFEDAVGFLGSLPAGERACMAAYAGGDEGLLRVFSAQQQAPNESFVDQIDSCLSETTRRNIVVGRILVVESALSENTLQCMEETMSEPTLKPLFGIFSETDISKQWITTHFCMTDEERVGFHNSLYSGDPERPPVGSGETFIDIQECMVSELGADQYFAPVDPPDTSNLAAMAGFYGNFSRFMVADLRCQYGDTGSPMSDGTVLTGDIAQCVIDDIGTTKFGQTILGRSSWSPSADEHSEIVSSFYGCGAETDFLALPEGLGSLSADDTSCLAAELMNSDDVQQTSLRAFADIGRINPLKAGDLSALLFGADKCGIEVPGLPADATLSEPAVMCIVGKIDQEVYSQDRSGVFAEFSSAVEESANCFASN